jgi:hypothetical protein
MIEDGLLQRVQDANFVSVVLKDDDFKERFTLIHRNGFPTWIIFGLKSFQSALQLQ